MHTVTIELTDFQMALAQHKYADVEAYATNLVTARLDQYGIDLSNRVVQRALDADSAASVPMDRATIVQSMFDADGYHNAAERLADEEAQRKAATFPIAKDGVIV